MSAKQIRMRDVECRLPGLGLLMLSACLFGLAACGGGGGGGGTTGGSGGGGTYDPPGGGGGTGNELQPTLQSIQDNVFTPICTECHAGANAPQGLRLEEGMSYGMLVNVASSEVPSLDRVEPGDPDNSYLIQKLEGTAAEGARMPFGGPYLAQEDINVIRQWITDGAPETSSKPSSKAAVLSAGWPVEGAVLQRAPAGIILIADTELDTTLLHAGSVGVFKRDGGSLVRVDGVEMEITSLAPTVMRLKAPADAFGPGRYEVRVDGTGAAPVADRSGKLIDGDADGKPGGDFVLHFELAGGGE